MDLHGKTLEAMDPLVKTERDSTMHCQ